MRLQSVKSAKDTGVPGVQFVYTDKQITEVVFGKLRIRKGESYSAALQVLVEKPFDEAKRHRMVGKMAGFPDAVSYHEHSHEAEQAANELRDKGAEATVTEVTVLLNDDGEVVSEAEEGVEPTAAPTAFEVPF